jgi:hypothetical protein
VRVEADLYEAAHQPIYEDGWENRDLLTASDLLDGQDAFIAFLVRAMGRLPLIHVSYFRSRLVTAQIAYALMHDEVDAAEGQWEVPDAETLRKRHRQIGQSYTEQAAPGEAEESCKPVPLRRVG